MVYTDPTIITEEYDDGERVARWTGIASCQRSGCPICGPEKARKFGKKVQRTIGGGGTWQHVIFTVPHSTRDSWQVVYDRLCTGLRDVSKGGCGSIVMTEVEATIRATETTWSVRSGWHVHLHVLWRLRRPLLEEEKAIVTTTWCGRTGASLDHGVAFGMTFDSSTASDAAGYLTKIAAEMAGAQKRAHGEHWTLGELYHRAAEGDEMMLDRVQEYIAQTKGRRLYQFDRRALRLHDAAPELDELKPVRQWIIPVHRLEFRALSRIERFRGDPLACYLPLEVAVRCRGDPTDAILDTIYDLAAAAA